MCLLSHDEFSIVSQAAASQRLMGNVAISGDDAEGGEQ